MQLRNTFNTVWCVELRYSFFFFYLWCLFAPFSDDPFSFIQIVSFTLALLVCISYLLYPQVLHFSLATASPLFFFPLSPYTSWNIRGGRVEERRLRFSEWDASSSIVFSHSLFFLFSTHFKLFFISVFFVFLSLQNHSKSIISLNSKKKKQKKTRGRKKEWELLSIRFRRRDHVDA